MNNLPFFVAFGDVHNDISKVDAIAELCQAAGIIVSGDLTFAGGTRDALRVLEPLAGRVPRLLAQIGNMDRAEVDAVLEEKGWNLHRKAQRLFPGVYALGLGASPPTPFQTPSEYPEEVMAEWLAEALAEAKDLFAAEKGDTALGKDAPALVLVSHTPPYATVCDRLTSGAAAGSRVVRAFIEKYEPCICVCGHIHEARAEDRLGRTHIVNPGPLSGGGYVLIYPDSECGARAELKGPMFV
ncbi:MAG: metallophosphoesterase family protein [Desulfovibrio sp.]|jgi:Icc-related predicted phosphoesterase|nr:metallophosphoesterase family protein [Desulfovibrio sp.]